MKRAKAEIYRAERLKALGLNPNTGKSEGNPANMETMLLDMHRKLETIEEEQRFLSKLLEKKP